VERQGERIDVGGVQRQPEDDYAVRFEEPDDVRDGPGGNPPPAPDALGEVLDLLSGGVKPWWWQLGQRDRGQEIGRSVAGGQVVGAKLDAAFGTEGSYAQG
jgi:hypothetical protein